MAKRPQGEQTASRLLGAALDVYARHGDAGFTVHAVVETSGVSLGSLYHPFGSFDGLAAALYARCLAQLVERIADAVEAERGPRAGIVALVDAYLAFTREHAVAARFVHASAYARFLPAHAAAIAAAKAPHLERLFAWLRPHVHAGKIVALPPALFEVLVVGPVAEAARRWLAGAPDLDLDEAARLLPERIWQGVRR